VTAAVSPSSLPLYIVSFRAGLWSSHPPRFARCLGAIGLRLDYVPGTRVSEMLPRNRNYLGVPFDRAAIDAVTRHLVPLPRTRRV
jgi:hypothetical protein